MRPPAIQTMTAKARLPVHKLMNPARTYPPMKVRIAVSFESKGGPVISQSQQPKDLIRSSAVSM